jgi:hypothetical protein
LEQAFSSSCSLDLTGGDRCAERTNHRRETIRSWVQACQALDGDTEQPCCFLTYLPFTLLLFPLLKPYFSSLFFKILLLKSSFLFFKVSFLRLTLSHDFSLAFLKSRFLDLHCPMFSLAFL